MNYILKRMYIGYLAYDQRAWSAFIPNEEIRTELANAAETPVTLPPSPVPIILLFPQTSVCCAWPRPYMHPMISLISSI